ncbi:MAG: hypothetical protein LKG27_08240 [Clostridiaceae bacterium]|nr:hypothetical protein [Clostridiaceae bacterium]
MAGQQNNVYDLLKMIEVAIEEGLTIIPNKYTVIKKDEVCALINEVFTTLPVEIQEARAFLRRREELQIEAQQRAERIIAEAQAEADRKLSEADFLKALEREGDRIRSQVKDECEEMKRRANEEADAIRSQATDDSLKIKEGAEMYAEQVLTTLEKNLAEMQSVVKNGQIFMEQKRGDSSRNYSMAGGYPQKDPQKVQ